MKQKHTKLLTALIAQYPGWGWEKTNFSQSAAVQRLATRGEAPPFSAETN